MTAVILVLCAAVFGWEVLVMTAGGQDALEALVGQWGLVPKDLVAAVTAGNLLSPPVVTLVTHMFLHGSWLHLLGNLLFLWIFAVNVEDRLGRILFPALYVLGGLAAAAAHILVDPASDLPMVGASGAISAVLGAYVVLYPRARIQSLVFPLFFYELMAVPAVAVLGYWFLLQLIDGIASLGLTAEAGGGIALWAHVGGFVAGMAMALPLRSLRPIPAPPPVARKRTGDEPAPVAASGTPPPGPQSPAAPPAPPPPPGPPAPLLPPPPPGT